jgi:hypothetical protein
MQSRYSTHCLSPVTRHALYVNQHPTGNALATICATFKAAAPARKARPSGQVTTAAVFVLAVCAAVLGILLA